MTAKSDLRSRLTRVRSLPDSSSALSSVLPPAPAANDRAPGYRSPKSGPRPRPVTPLTAYDAPTLPGEPIPARVERELLRAAERERELLRTAEREREAERARRARSKRRALAYGATVAVVGALLGMGFGTLSEKRRVALQAVNGAEQLIADVDGAERVLSALTETLAEARTALDSGAFPTEPARKLAELRIPFDGAHLAHRGIGRFKPPALAALFDYTAAVAQANVQHERLLGLLSVSRTSVEAAFAQRSQPEFQWAVFLQNEALGPVANVRRLPRPFAMNGGSGWPPELEMTDERGRVSLKRYLGGDPLVAGQAVQLIPVAPESQAAVCPSDSARLLVREIDSLSALLAGDPTPGQEVPSLAQRGRVLRVELAKIGPQKLPTQ